MSYQMPFEQVSELLCRELSSPQVICNWTVDKGYFGEHFSAQQKGSRVLCVLPSNRRIRVPKGDFEQVHRKWPRYIAGQIPRTDIRDITFCSKYIISIFHQFLD